MKTACVWGGGVDERKRTERIRMKYRDETEDEKEWSEKSKRSREVKSGN